VPGEVHRTPAPPASREVRAFAPGRVNLIGEHTDYNDGLALPFAIAEGVFVHARESQSPTPGIRAYASDLGEHDEFSVAQVAHAPGWRAFVRGVAAELHAAGVPLPDVELEIHGEVRRGAGLSSSAALEIALALALLELADAKLDYRTLAALCSRVENLWVGARTGLLDQLASLFGQPREALLIDFSSLAIEPIPLELADGWRMVTLDSGEPHSLAQSGYNERRAECAQACELLGVASLREIEQADGAATPALARLPATLARRVRHVLDENTRVLATVAALHRGDLARVGGLLDESHASLRDNYECSTPAVEATVRRLRKAGAAGARMTGGGFGGSVLALLPPGTQPPSGAHEVRPSPGARLLAV
jgi:galactokinase